jgi:hypothetical protein
MVPFQLPLKVTTVDQLFVWLEYWNINVDVPFKVVSLTIAEIMDVGVSDEPLCSWSRLVDGTC